MPPEEIVTADLVVVGGGIAGTTAALAAARLGCKTVLINDRPVLGGNASSEVRVWINGATGGYNNRYSREGGIMEELLQRNKHDNPGGSPDIWDAILIDVVRETEGLECYLNTLVTDVSTDSDRVEAVTGHQLMSEKTFTFEGSLFVDATGDGIVAADAGAVWVQGREGREVFGERAAPETGDNRTLGSSIMFSSKIRNEPIEYEPPEFAEDFTTDTPEIIAKRTDPQQHNECYWWIEYGGEEALDPIADNEEIRDELWAIVYGVWDYIKNSGEFPEEEVANLQLEWVGKIPGKRESRRVMGDYVLTQEDLVEQRRFDDRVGHGGWSIDLHPPSGIYDDQGRGSEHFHLDGPYSIPYRSLYSPDLTNVFLAGRHLSASHIAFGSVRVQMTLATAGQAVGTAAAVCTRQPLSPAELSDSDEAVETLQQLLLRNDQWVIGLPNRDPTDHARDASVRATSTRSDDVTESETVVSLDGDTDIGIHLAHLGTLETVSLLLSASDGTRSLEVDVYDESRPENTIPNDHLRTETVSIPGEGPSWVDIPIEHAIGEEAGIFLVVRSPGGINLHATERELTGVMALPRQDNTNEHLKGFPDQDAFWGHPGDHARTPYAWVPCLQTTPASDSPRFDPANVIDGYARPSGLGHSWISTRFEPAENAEKNVVIEPEWLEFTWDEPRTISAFQCAFNTRLNEWFNIYGDEDRAEPECVRDYRVDVHNDGEWKTVIDIEGNFQRFRRHTFDPIETDRLRLVIEATNGVPWAEVFECRIYGPDHEFPLVEH